MKKQFPADCAFIGGKGKEAAAACPLSGSAIPRSRTENSGSCKLKAGGTFYGIYNS